MDKPASHKLALQKAIVDIPLQTAKLTLLAILDKVDLSIFQDCLDIARLQSWNDIGKELR